MRFSVCLTALTDSSSVGIGRFRLGLNRYLVLTILPEAGLYCSKLLVITLLIFL